MGVLDDLRLTWRGLRRAPGFAVVAVLTLALGVAATTTMFSAVEGVLLRPLAFPDPDRLVDVSETLAPGHWHGAVSTPDLADWRRQARSFTALGGYSTRPGFALAEGDRPERIPGVRLTPELLPALGAHPLLGRLFLPEEATPGRDRVLLVGEALWRRRFGAAPDLVGRKLTVNGLPLTVVGIVPAWLRFPPGREAAQLFLPLVPDAAMAAQRGAHWMQALGRLRPGVSLAAAQAEMDSIARSLESQDPDTNEGRGVQLLPLQEYLTAAVRTPLWTLLGAVGLMLAIACVNVANLLVARAAARGRETAVCSALGAGHWRLARRCLVEGLVLALLGAAAALPLIWLGLHTLLALAPASLPRRGDIALDGSVLAFAIVVSAATSLLFSLAPIWQIARLDAGEQLKAGGRVSAGIGGRRLRGLLVLVEMSLSLVLLAGAGLLLRSFWNLSRVDPGFRTAGVLTADLVLPEARYGLAGGSGSTAPAFYSRLAARLAALPGVTASGLISVLPARDWGVNAGIEIAGAPPLPASTENVIEVRAVSPGYFRAMGPGRASGRLIADEDGERAPRVVVINQEAARRFWHGADPVGARVTIGGDERCEVVGVVHDVHNAGPARSPLPEAYFPFTQAGERNMTLVLRTAGDPYALVPMVRRAVQELDRDLPLDHITTMDRVVAGAIDPSRFQTVLLAIFAALAAGLAAIGLYGLLSYAVVQRRQEIAVRVALGATAARVRGLVLHEALRLVAAGAAIGLAATAALRGVLARFVFGIAPLDPLTLAAVALGLAAVALLASLAPAERAVRTEVLPALREP